ncbi:MAG TPA: hypothetical protein VKD72_03340, partial [Gemmataceae bacterium]|nr:hypothetical protein [Gemmataceae bacterium]
AAVCCNGRFGIEQPGVPSDPVEDGGHLARPVEHGVVARVERHHSHPVAQVRRHAVLMARRQRPLVAQALDVRAAGRSGAGAAAALGMKVANVFVARS